MPRLIDADALFEKVPYGDIEHDVKISKCGAIADICTWILTAPTIDAVPVVRCAECKYWLCVEDGFGDCTNRRFHLDGCADPSMKMDDFCSCGERRKRMNRFTEEQDRRRRRRLLTYSREVFITSMMSLIWGW